MFVSELGTKELYDRLLGLNTVEGKLPFQRFKRNWHDDPSRAASAPSFDG